MTKRKRKDGITELSNGKFNATVWMVDEREKRVKKEKTFGTKTLAKEWRNSFKTDLLRGEIGITTARVTVKQATEKYIEHYEEYYKSKYSGFALKLDVRMSPIRNALSGFCDVVGESKRIIKLSREDIEAWKKHRKAEGVTNQTVNYSLQHVRKCLNMAKVFYAELKKWSPPPIENLPQSKRRRKRILSLSEEAAIYTELQKADPEMADYFLILIDTGLRQIDAARLKPSQVFFQHPLFQFGIIELSTAKTEAPIVIPLTQAIREILYRRIQDESIFTFANHSFGAIRAHVTYYVREAAKRANIPYGREIANGFYIHDLRRTAINRMLSRTNYDYASVSLITGVSVKVLLEHYARPDEAQMMRAMTRNVGVEDSLILSPDEGGN